MAEPTVRVRVYHAGYGCDTGCCGHIVEITLPGGQEKSHFEFEHPPYCPPPSPLTSEDRDECWKAWARKLAEDAIRDRWPECFESIDWDSMQVEASDD
jgi:hypothetical protein